MSERTLEQELWYVVFEHFYETADWPTLRNVYLKLRRRISDFDLTEDELRNGLRVYTSDAPVAFRVEQLATIHDERAQWILHDFLRTVRFIGEKQINASGDNPHITASEARGTFTQPPLNDLDWRRIVRLIEGEGFILGGGQGGENFDLEIGPEAHRYATVDSVQAYLAERARLLPREEITAEQVPDSGSEFIKVQGFRPPSR